MQVRVINVATAAKTLIKCHPQTIVELSLAPKVPSLLCSASSDGTLAFHTLVKVSSEIMQVHVLAILQLPEDGALSGVHVTWNPESIGNVFVAVGSALLSIELVTVTGCFTDAGGVDPLPCLINGMLPDGAHQCFCFQNRMFLGHSDFEEMKMNNFRVDLTNISV